MNQEVQTLNLPKHLIKEIKTLGSYCNDHITPENTQISIYASQIEKATKLTPSKSCLDLYLESSVLGQISTFLSEFDSALQGGIPLGQITEFCSEPGHGKSQICYHLCVYVQLPAWCGGIEGRAVFISTNKSLAPQRIREIACRAEEKYANLTKIRHTEAQSAPFTVEQILKGIYSVLVGDLLELIAAVKYLDAYLTTNCVKLLIIDTISTIFKQEENEARSYLFNILEDMKYLARKYKLAIVVTNDMTTRVNKEGPYITASLGDMYYHTINNRILLTKIGENTFSGRILKSSFMPPRHFNFSMN